MRKKMQLTKDFIVGWMDDIWTLYASQMVDGELLRLYINGSGVFRVIHGEIVLYQGDDIDPAIDVWNRA